MPDGMTYKESLAQRIKSREAGLYARDAEALAKAAGLAEAEGDPLVAAYLRDLAMCRRIAGRARPI